MKILNPQIHGFLDYGLALTLYVAPTLFGFSATPAMLAYIVATAQLVTSLATAYPLGVMKLIPFPVHGVIESLVAVGLIAFPWVLGFASETNPRNFFVGAGVVLLVVVALTDYKGKGTAPAR